MDLWVTSWLELHSTRYSRKYAFNLYLRQYTLLQIILRVDAAAVDRAWGVIFVMRVLETCVVILEWVLGACVVVLEWVLIARVLFVARVLGAPVVVLEWVLVVNVTGLNTRMGTRVWVMWVWVQVDSEGPAATHTHAAGFMGFSKAPVTTYNFESALLYSLLV